MSSNALPSPVILACFVLLCTILWRISANGQWPTGRETLSHPRSSFWLRRVMPALLCAFLCAVGAVLLVPWATRWPLGDRVGWAAGIIFVGFLSAGAFWAMGRRGDG